MVLFNKKLLPFFIFFQNHAFLVLFLSFEIWACIEEPIWKMQNNIC